MTELRRLGAGEALPLVRSIANDPDPLDLFCNLTAGGAAPDTILLESGDTEDRRSEKSLVIVSSALRLTCRDRGVQISALNVNGRNLLPWLRNRFQGVALEETGSGFRIEFPPRPAGNEEKRMKAPSPVDALRAVIGGLEVHSASASHLPIIAGVFGYDLLGTYESLPEPASDPMDWPEFEFWLADQMIWIHHKQHSSSVVTHAFGGEHSEAAYHDSTAAISRLAEACSSVPAGRRSPRSPVSQADRSRAVDMADEEFCDLVDTMKGHIVAGDVFQIVPSRTFSAPCPDPVAAYRKLRSLNPSPYMFLVNGTKGTLFGSSPETAVRVSGQPKRVEIRPIAGTRHRGRTFAGSLDQDLDSRLEAELRLDEKELAEHMMLVDLARNDVARVSTAGTRQVDRLLTVERYSHVMHLVSHISGVLRPDLDALHAYVSSMNMGTLVGAPKVMAARLLRKYERAARGPYGGAVGYVTTDGEMDTSIIIRSAVVQDGIAYVRAGAGVVYDSQPESEAAETRRKAEAVLRAIDQSVAEGEP